MATEDSEVTAHLTAFLTLNEAAAKAFPELPSISERTILLAALVHVEADGYIGYEVWAEHLGIHRSTLERFAKFFASFGFISLEDSCGGSVRLDQSTLARLHAAIGSRIQE